MKEGKTKMVIKTAENCRTQISRAAPETSSALPSSADTLKLGPVGAVQDCTLQRLIKITHPLKTTTKKKEKKKETNKQAKTKQINKQQ